MRNIGKAGVLAVALSALSFTAYAAETGRGPVQSDQPAATGTAPGGAGSATVREGWPSFSQLDQDGTGFITQQEAASVSDLNFMSADTDGDGRLSRSEYEAAMRGAPSTGGEGGSPVGPSGGSGPGSSPSGSGSGGYPER